MEDKIVLTQILGGLDYNAVRQVELTKSQLAQQLKPDMNKLKEGYELWAKFKVIKTFMTVRCEDSIGNEFDLTVEDTVATFPKQEQPQKIELTSLQIMDLYNQKIAPHEVLPESVEYCKYCGGECKAKLSKQEQPQLTVEEIDGLLKRHSPKPQPECTCIPMVEAYPHLANEREYNKDCKIHGSPKDKSEPQTMSERDVARKIAEGLCLIKPQSAKPDHIVDTNKKVERLEYESKYSNHFDNVIHNLQNCISAINRLSEQAKTTGEGK
jgi:hypothetical protein